MIRPRVYRHGEVSEWLIEQPWKGCVGLVSTVPSNPTLSGFNSGSLSKIGNPSEWRLYHAAGRSWKKE
jgi:hypothetical protein